ncbi:unnamed protein product [Closterium sp. NIES-53]
MPATATVEQTGVKSVPIRSGGYQKERIAVMLACMATGEKLKPWVVFKRKTVPKGDFLNGKDVDVLCVRLVFASTPLTTVPFFADVVVGVQENRSMAAENVIKWLDKAAAPFIKPKFGVQGRSTLLVLDSYRGHLTKEVKKKFAEYNIIPAVIPAGCTAEVQPLNVAINKSFKASVRQQYQNWFEEEGMNALTAAGEHHSVFTSHDFQCLPRRKVLTSSPLLFTRRAGNIKKPRPAVILKWVSKAWRAVPAELIKKAFLACGISNALDGSEDKLAMAHRRSQLTHEVDVDDEIQADGF